MIDVKLILTFDSHTLISHNFIPLRMIENYSTLQIIIVYWENLQMNVEIQQDKQKKERFIS